MRDLLQWSQRRPDAEEYIDNLYDVSVRLRDFSVPASIVGQSDEATLREIFDRTNNAGKKLGRAEVFHALFSESRDTGITIEAISDSLQETSFGRIPADTVLQAILARRHPDFTRDLRQEFVEDRGLVLNVRDDESQEEAFEGGRESLRQAINFLQADAEVPHITFLPYKYLLTTVSRFFAHHPDPHPRNRNLLVRWFWRASVAPTIFSGSATAMGRGFASRIVPDDEDQSVQDLLSLVPADFAYIKPDVRQFRTNTAATKVMLCALFSYGPRQFATGDVLDRETLADNLEDAQTANPAVARVVPRGAATDSALAQGIGGRFLLAANDVAVDEARVKLAGGSPSLFSDCDELASSHLVGEQSARLLRDGRYEDFVQQRNADIQEVLDSFLQVKMSLELPSHPPLDRYDLDEDGEGWSDD